MVEMRSLDGIRTVLRILFACAAAAAVVGMIQVARSPLPFGRAAFFMGEGFLYSHGPYAAYLGFAMGPAFVFLMMERMSRRTWPVLAVAFLVTAATVISLSRAGWLSTLVLLAVLALARGRVFLRKLAVPIAVVSAVLVVGFMKSPFAAQALSSYVERSTEEDYGSNVDRLQRYVAALRMFRDRPLTGVGPGAYEQAYDDYRSVDFDTGVRGTHSEILRASSEQGLPGLAILLFLVFAFYRTGLRLMRKAPDPRVRTLAAAICAGMLTYTVHGIVNEYWRDAKVALVMWVLAGLLAALEQMSRAEGAAEATAPRTA
jgi:O-antigen ligase